MRKRFFPAGSILILVLWVLLLLSIFTFSAGYAAQQRLRLLDRLEEREKLRAIAEAGVRAAAAAVNREDDKARLTDALNEPWSRNEKEYVNVDLGHGVFSCEVRDEESKINLNGIKSALILTRLFETVADLPEDRASELAMAILDWRDEDSDLQASGAETRFYQSLNPPYAAKNTALDILEELLFVKGMDSGILEQIRPFVTLSGDTKVNLNTAPHEVLYSLGASESLLKAILAFRAGRDRLPGTKDDGIFTDLSAAGQALEQTGNGGPDEKTELDNLAQSGKLDIRSEHFSVLSRARLFDSDAVLEVRAVLKRGTGITGWQESWEHEAQ